MTVDELLATHGLILSAETRIRDKMLPTDEHLGRLFSAIQALQVARHEIWEAYTATLASGPTDRRGTP